MSVVHKINVYCGPYNKKSGFGFPRLSVLVSPDHPGGLWVQVGYMWKPWSHLVSPQTCHFRPECDFWRPRLWWKDQCWGFSLVE